MSSIFASLTALGNRKGALDVTWQLPRGWALELETGEVTELKGAVELPKKIDKRGNTAKQRPNFCFDTARYALSSDALFLEHCLSIAMAAKDAQAQKALQQYKEKPVASRKGIQDLPKGAESPLRSSERKQIKLEDWVVLTLKGAPLAMRPKIFAEFQRRTAVSLSDGPRGICLVTGVEAPIARTHPSITFGAQGGSTTNLYSVNEGAMQHFGTLQGFNYPTGVETSQLYTSGLNGSFADAAFLTDDHVITAWPETEGTTHAIIPIIKTLCYAYHKNDRVDVIEAKWRQLEGLTDLDTVITLAGLQHKMSRIVIRHYAHLTVRELQKNLLAFRETFLGFSPLVVLPRFIPHEGKESAQQPSEEIRIKVKTLSDCCYLDTIWALLTGGTLPAPFKDAVRTNLARGMRAHDLKKGTARSLALARLKITRRWTETFFLGMPPEKTEMKEDRKERLAREVAAAENDASLLPGLVLRERMSICNEDLRPEFLVSKAEAVAQHEAEMAKLEGDALKKAKRELLELHNQQDQYNAYRWGRYVAMGCFLRIYSHALRNKHDLPNAYSAALRTGRQNPQGFRARFDPQLYADQVKQRSKGRGTKVLTFLDLYSTFADVLAPTILTPELADFVHVGFHTQMNGLQRCRLLKDRQVLNLKDAEDEDADAA